MLTKSAQNIFWSLLITLVLVLTPWPNITIANANETDYQKPISASCIGSTGTVANCDVSRLLNQDDSPISWTNSGAEFLITGYNSFNIPDNAVIKAFQWQAKIKANSSGWSFFPGFSNDSGNTWYSYTSCLINNFAPNPFPCQYNTIVNYATPTLYVIPHPTTPVSVSSLNNGTFRFRWFQSAATKNVDIDFFQVKVIYDVPAVTPTLTPTSAPTQTPAPTPTPSVSPTPAPFLDLPWAYGKNNFVQNAFNPNSWFDHEYPLQNIGCCVKKVRIYTGKEVDDFYRSHSGYDWGSINNVFLYTPVLAAASGTATFVPESKSGGAGNLIKIDHKNGYQTWYEHLHWDVTKDDHGLIVDQEGESEDVTSGQQIGLVGMSGNTNGPHIHLSVFKDENNNGTFTDDYPYGLVDPLGWEGNDTDPWTDYTNTDESKHGAESFNLYLARIDPVQAAILASGGTLNTGKVKVEVPNGASAVPFTLKFEDGPFESNSAALRSATPTFYLTALNSLGEKITQFLNPITITYSYADATLLNINEDSLKLYHYIESTKQWEQLPSNLNKVNKTITAETLGFSQFAVMGELKDLAAPVTHHALEGTQSNENWFRSNVNVVLSAADNSSGLGIEYTLFKLDDNDWQEYEQAITAEDEGVKTLKYKSIDKAYNIEDEKSLTFTIDKTAPVTTASVSGTDGLGGWFRSDVGVSLTASDNGEVDRTEYSLDGGESYVSYSEPISVSAEGVIDILYRSVDKAGNVEEAKLVKVKIDKIAPASLVYTTGVVGKNGWFLSDVSVSLNALEEGAGYDKTFYSFDGEAFVEYLEPVVISTEGPKKIYYYSTDKAGNKEERKEFVVKIDKTAPFAEFQYDINAQDIKVIGKDNFQNNLSTSAIYTGTTGEIIIVDQAGNILKILVKDKEKGKNARLSIVSLQYNDGSVITLDKNTFSVKNDFFDVTTNTVKKFDQDWKVNDLSKVSLSYSQSDDTTSVKTRNNDGSISSNVVPGKKFLKVATDNAALKYSY